MHAYDLSRLRMGRDAYLSDAGARYDRLVSNNASLIIDIIAGMLIVAVIVGAYEVVGLILRKVINRVSV